MATKNISNQSGEPTVYLGYIESGDLIDHEIQDADDCSSTATTSNDDPLDPWLVNKIGGLPVFPYNKSNLDELEAALDSMKCKHCKSLCVLVFQMNSAIDDVSLGRVLQVYTCVKNDCIKHSWFTMRCMLSDAKTQDKHQVEPETLQSKKFDYILHPSFGPILVCRKQAFFKPYYVSVMEEPTGKENFVKNNLEALKLASKFSDPDLKPAPIEAKYKNLKNYKPPQPPAHLSDLEDFEKFQLEKLYGNDKDMYRFYKRLNRFQSQIVRYDWEGQPLLNSAKIKLNVLPCANCSGKRKFEFQLMSALINYLKTDQEFDRETMDFSSIIVHSCSKNCSSKAFNIEDTYFMPDPDSRIFNKVKQKMLALKLGEKSKMELEPQQEDTEMSHNALEEEDADNDNTCVKGDATTTVAGTSTQSGNHKKNKKKKKNKK